MVVCNGIEMYIARKSDGQRYAEYTPPAGSLAYTGNPNEVYIQAREGEHFAVRRRGLPDFDFKGVTHLKTNIAIGEHQGAFLAHSREEIEVAGESGHVTSYSSSTKYTDGIWMRCALTFSALSLDEELDTSEDCVSREIERSGRITISVQRGSAKYLPTPKPRNAAHYASVTKSTSSKVVVNSGLVSHTIEYVLQVRIIILELTAYSLVPLQQIAPLPIAKAFEVALGLTGRRIAFIFRARSAACLRLLKIVGLDEDEATTAQDISTKTMSSVSAGPVTDSPKAILPTTKREHAVAFDEDDITIVGSRRAPNMQMPEHSVPNIASIRQSKLTEVDRERKTALLQLRRKEMDLEREELAPRKRELAMEREELDLA
ncbi:hypothetical protein LTR95_016231 [Oleoguttula sp. CCFEE 5521]